MGLATHNMISIEASAFLTFQIHFKKLAFLFHWLWNISSNEDMEKNQMV